MYKELRQYPNRTLVNSLRIARIGQEETEVEVEYDVCDKNIGVYNESIFEYIGEGYIFSIDGVEQNPVRGIHPPLHFWKRI